MAGVEAAAVAALQVGVPVAARWVELTEVAVEEGQAAETQGGARAAVA